MRDETLTDKITEQAKFDDLKPTRWVDDYADNLYNFALKRVNDETLAQDLVQDTFLSALEKAHHYRAESSERTWLTAILKNKIVDTYRNRNNILNGNSHIGSVEDEPEFFDPDLNNWKKEHWPAPFTVDNEDALHNKEFMNVLRKCMTKLPSLWMAVFKLKHLDDEETGFICKKLRLTSANYWVIIHRAKVNLRSCLQKNWM